MNRQGPAHRPMGLAFPPAATAAGRGALSNGKLGGWIGAPPPGVPTLANRSATGLTFSQSVGGLSQPSTPLDMNEFPALGGQTQSNPAQAWSRINTQSPQNRGLSQQQQHPHQPPTSQQPQHLQSSQQQHDGFPNAQKDIFARMDDYRIGGIGVGGGGAQSQGQNQDSQMQPQGVMEDFPALPRTQPGSLGVLEERGLGGLGQRQGMSSRLLPHVDGMMGQQAPMASSDVEKKNILKAATINGAPGLSNNPPSTLALGSQQPPRPSPAPGLTHPSQLQPQPQQTLQKPGGINGDSPSISQIGTPPNTVSEDDRFGLSGLFNAMRGDAGEGSSLAKGQDLMMLGLDINSPDGALWPSFASPFAELEATAVEPEYQLPNCYTVVNTQPVHSKIGSFSDETLFYVFYTMPRDIMQEVVVAELAARNWRYHMLHRLWMTKDNTAQVEQFSEIAEKGIYVFFDPTTWERVRVIMKCYRPLEEYLN
ncbi:hypothetical protein BDD12DRAFT_428294 [Trichophaea hybrida]|nr:hypothetical protein BDD12DRAFT_428294 [Trichophaea hybrida]